MKREVFFDKNKFKTSPVNTLVRQCRDNGWFSRYNGEAVHCNGREDAQRRVFQYALADIFTAKAFFDRFPRSEDRERWVRARIKSAFDYVWPLTGSEKTEYWLKR